MNDLGIHMPQKEFAASAIKHSASFLLFSARKSETSPREEFFKMSIDKQISTVVKWYQQETGDQYDN